ncbi:MAG: hypothetical protein ACD_2C00201G0010 [uncultured bacterium (gcode 4)]|uniref:FAD:protein FMN transferase n=1 Tax=uncultured bacterium (gcode 4) TaxID=1234023 RepID=K2G218_9BACT|nr:MAG: hypothetical protein ACD_2C00201G0010 [uncultured bacterium (gcode 4)]
MEYKQTKKMLWTDIEISIIWNDERIERRLETIFDFFASFEQEFSRFLPHSSVSMLNAYWEYEVSERFMELMNLSKRFYSMTDWYFNPLVDLSKIWYGKDFMKNEFSIEERESDTDFPKVRISWRKIVLEKNQRLDFWWVGKWYAADLATQILHNFWYDDFFINAWWDIFASWLNAKGKSWVVWIENPFDWSLLWTIDISWKAIATSGNYKRNWQIGGKKYHHILNPKTLGNNFEISSVTLIADKTSEADALTKAIFNMTPKESLEFIEENNLNWIIITGKGEIMTSKHIGDFGFSLIEN